MIHLKLKKMTLLTLTFNNKLFILTELTSLHSVFNLPNLVSAGQI